MHVLVSVNGAIAVEKQASQSCMVLSGNPWGLRSKLPRIGSHDDRVKMVLPPLDSTMTIGSLLLQVWSVEQNPPGAYRNEVPLKTARRALGNLVWGVA